MGVSRRFGVAVVVLAATAAAGLAWQPAAQPQNNQPTNPPARQPGDRGPGQRGPGGQPASVGGSMKALNRAARQLKSQIADASKKDENLKLIDEMERAAATAKAAPLPADVLKDATTDADKARLAAAFRKDLMGALRTMLDMEQDLIDGKNDDAAKRLTELVKQRDAAHKEMGLKEEE